MTDDLITRAENALQGVTDGPWEAVHVGNIHWGVGEKGSTYPSVVYAHSNWEGFGNGSRKVNAEFIAAARSLVPELVSALKAARAENERLQRIERAVQDELTNITDDFVYDRLAKAVELREVK